MSIGDRVTMFYNAKPHIFEKAFALRKNMTPPEQKLWDRLKGKKVLGLRFRPQHPIDIFIADFYCHPLKLVIEVDGDIHKSRDRREYDIGREAEIGRWGIRVIRYTNQEIEEHLEEVVNSIRKNCKMRKEELNQSPLSACR
jgi:very-short-patch-repair endonuclease